MNEIPFLYAVRGKRVTFRYPGHTGKQRSVLRCDQPSCNGRELLCADSYCLYNGVKTLTLQAKPLSQPTKY